jgi:hypothetical protein
LSSPPALIHPLIHKVVAHGLLREMHQAQSPDRFGSSDNGIIGENRI